MRHLFRIETKGLGPYFSFFVADKTRNTEQGTEISFFLVKKEKVKRLFIEAYEWLCHSRIKHPSNADIWDFRWKWSESKTFLINAFSNGSYQLDVQRRTTIKTGDEIDICRSKDALVLKVVTKIVEKCIFDKISNRCFHVKGRGGLKGAIRDVMANKEKYPFVFRTDIKSYYDSINHEGILSKLKFHVKDKRILNLVWQYLNRTVDKNGIFYHVKKGIPMGSPLSPLLGALYLHELDNKLEMPGVFYIRYMDDILVMAAKRWKLKKAIRTINRELEKSGLEKHPDKTYIGSIEKGFDFLGYHIGPAELRLAKKTIENFINRSLRLYEQGPPVSRQRRLEAYITNWMRWANGGLGEFELGS